MCGITGLLEPGELTVDAVDTLGAMMDAIAHRGPDGSGSWLDHSAGIALGHRRLAIIDITANGRQPMVSRSGRYVLTFNGEIYNYCEIRAQLEDAGRPIEWRGRSDTEVLVEAIDTWGLERTLPLLDGMFAFAVWDRARQVLTLARDRMGEKPLYYGKIGQTFVFGSELKALHCHPRFTGEVDRQALTLMLRYDYIPAPHSIWRDISKLQPGHAISIDASGQIVGAATPYWERQCAIEACLVDPFEPSEDLEGYLHTALRNAVARQMVADVPLGAFLSGGIDSSLITALMQAQSTQPVSTFTIGFDEPSFDEAPYAKSIAAHLGTDHTEVYVSAQDALDVIPRLPLIWDEPFGDSSKIPTFLVSSIARRSVTVALSGDGGDELFGGYSRYRSVAAIERATRRFPAVAKRLAGHLLRKRGSATQIPGHLGRAVRMLAATSPEALYGWSVCRLEDPSRLVQQAPCTLAPMSDPIPFVPHFQQKMMYADLGSYLPDNVLTKVDRAAMSVGLEVRVPLLDPEVIRCAWRLPIWRQIDGRDGKRVLRRVLNRYVPASMFGRPKMGFAVPVEHWLKGSLREWAEHLLDERRIRAAGVLDAVGVRNLWTDFLAGKRRHHRPIWNVLMFQAWAQQATGRRSR